MVKKKRGRVEEIVECSISGTNYKTTLLVSSYYECQQVSCPIIRGCVLYTPT